jgi:DNA repair/transcription protein MET18/MMS19
LRQEIFQGDGREVELAALEAVRDVASGLKGGVMQIDERDPLQEFVGLVLKDCTRHFDIPPHNSGGAELKVVSIATKVLRALGSSSGTALECVLVRVLPVIVKQFRSRELPAQKCVLLDSLVDLLREVAAHADQAEEVPSSLTSSKDEVIEVILGSLHSSDGSLRRIGICGVAVIVDVPALLDMQELVHCSLRLTDLALGDLADEVKRESAHALAVMSRTCPMVVTETVLPFILKKMGSGSDESMETDAVDDPEKLSSLTEKDLPLVYLMTALSVHHDVCGITIPVFVTCLEHLSGRRSQSLSREACLSLTGEICQQIVTVAESNKKDKNVMKTIGSILDRILRICVSEAMETDKMEDCVLTHDRTLMLLSTLYRLFVQNSTKMNSSRESSKMVMLFLEGDLSLVNVTQASSGAFEPLSSNSPTRQTKLVVLLKESVSSQDYEVLSPHYERLLPALLNLVLLCCNPFTCVNAAKTYSALLNKIPGEDEMGVIGSNTLDALCTSIQECGETEKKKLTTEALLWICRGLVVRSHPLGHSTVVKLLHLAKDQAIAEALGEHFGILLQDTQDILSGECRAIIRLMYKQQFFLQVLPVIVDLLQSAPEDMKSFCFRALSHLFRHVPKQVLLGELSNLIPVLVKSFDCPDVELRISSLESLHLLIIDTPSSITSYVPTLIPIFLDLVKSPDTMRIRIPALKCMDAMTTLPHHTVYPYRLTVIKGLLPCLDDKKRLVRKEASSCRSKWFLLGAA